MAKLFCARCNKRTDFDFRVDKLEFVAACQEKVQDPNDPDGIIACGHEVKFPEVKKKDELMAMIKNHNADNKPRLLLDEVLESTKAMEDMLADL